MYVRDHSTLSATLLGMPSEATRTIELAEALVGLATSREPLQVMPALLADASQHIKVTDAETRLRAAVEDAWLATPACWEFPVLLQLAIENPFVKFEELLGGATHRRIDAVYDLVEAEHCAYEVQGYYIGLLEEIRARSRSTGLKVGLTIGTFAGNFAGGWLGFGAGPATKAREWIEGEISPPTTLQFELAELLASWAHLSECEGFTADEKAAIHERCHQHMRKSARETGNEADIRAWLLVLDHIGGVPPTKSSIEMPDLVGQSLPAARFQVERLGLVCAVVDGAPEMRQIWSEANWRVVAQHPLRGSPVTAGEAVGLACGKHQEPSSVHKSAGERAQQAPNDYRSRAASDTAIADMDFRTMWSSIQRGRHGS